MRYLAYLEVVRLPNCILSGIGVVFSILVYSGYRLIPGLIAVGFITGFTATASAMVVNDVVDVEVDKVNKPWRPIPRGDIDPRRATIFASILAAIALSSNILIGIEAVLVTAIYIAIGVAYSYMRKHWWSHILVAVSTTGPVIYGYIVTGVNPEDASFTSMFTATVFTATLGREFMKAIQDIEGDMKYNYSTVATKLGVEKALDLTLYTGITSSAIALSTTLLDTSILYKILITIATTTYIYSVLKTYRKPREIEKSRKNTLISMYIGITAFWLSKTPI